MKTIRLENGSQANPSRSLKAQLEGTRHLSSYQIELEGSSLTTQEPFGPSPKGRIIYTSDGYMSVNIMQPGCARSETANPHAGTVQENSSAASHYLAYSGRYETFEGDGQKIVNHILDTSLFPNWLEFDQTRLCEIDGDRLVLRPVEVLTQNGIRVSAVLRWRRAESISI